MKATAYKKRPMSRYLFKNVFTSKKFSSPDEILNNICAIAPKKAHIRPILNAWRMVFIIPTLFAMHKNFSRYPKTFFKRETDKIKIR